MFEHLTPKAKEAAIHCQAALMGSDPPFDSEVAVQNLRNKASDLLAALAETPWQSIESAPKDGTVMQIELNGQIGFGTIYGGLMTMWSYQTRTSRVMDPHSYVAARWVPLPAPPEEANG